MSLTKVTEAAEPPTDGSTAVGRLRRTVTANWQFSAVLGVAAVARIVVMLGYPPAMFFNDSYNYITDAVTRSADIVRPDGYPLFLVIVEPFRSLALITALQAIMGLAIGAGIYAVLRRRGLPWWGATLPALPVLFDVFEMQLEHMIAADTLFTFCVSAALILLSWWDRPPLAAVVASGLLIGYATLVRSEGEALAVVLVVCLIARRVGWRRVVAAAIAWIIPVAGYMVWFHGQRGTYSLTQSSGTFLYSRVMSFAECAKMNPPADLRVLCDPRPPRGRPSSQEYLWSNQTPLAKLTGPNNIYRFTPHIEKLTRSFAERAIEAQPLAYATVVTKDVLRAFTWTRTQSNLEGSGSKFRFELAATPVPSWVTTSAVNSAAARRYGGPSLGETRVVRPWSTLLQLYQRVVYLRGPLLFGIIALGALGTVCGWRRFREWGWGGLCLMPTLVAVALIVGPAMTAGFSYRYVLAAMPPACLAAGFAFAGPGRGIIGWLREHGMVRPGS